MNILVINCGSSSLKYQVFRMEDEFVLAKGLAERIGINGSRFKYKPYNGEEVVIEQPIKNHGVAMELIIKALVDENYGVLVILQLLVTECFTVALSTETVQLSQKMLRM